MDYQSHLAMHLLIVASSCPVPKAGQSSTDHRPPSTVHRRRLSTYLLLMYTGDGQDHR